MKDPVYLSPMKQPNHIPAAALGRKRILVAPLNWGLGHATRCIPLIHALIQNNYEPVIATDGSALDLLRKEFPDLICLELPGYNIQYAENGRNFKLKLIGQLPAIVKAIYKEHSEVEKLAQQYRLDGIISDNRLGVFSKKIPSIFMTHQLRVLTGNTSWITTKIHHFFIKKFKECWVPDSDNKNNFSGKLGHLDRSKMNLKYIGTLSRLHKKAVEPVYDLMVILSGPEPQRGMLEKKLELELKKYNGAILFVRGLVEKEQTVSQRLNKTTYNYMNTSELELAFNQSKLVLCRSGYTTIMDLAQLGKKAFFIPTPGQYEQEYLAKLLDKKGLVPYCKQDQFRIEYLDRVAFYKGLKQQNNGTILWKDLFGAF